MAICLFILGKPDKSQVQDFWDTYSTKSGVEVYWQEDLREILSQVRQKKPNLLICYGDEWIEVMEKLLKELRWEVFDLLFISDSGKEDLPCPRFGQTFCLKPDMDPQRFENFFYSLEVFLVNRRGSIEHLYQKMYKKPDLGELFVLRVETIGGDFASVWVPKILSWEKVQKGRYEVSVKEEESIVCKRSWSLYQSMLPASFFRCTAAILVNMAEVVEIDREKGAFWLSNRRRVDLNEEQMQGFCTAYFNYKEN